MSRNDCAEADGIRCFWLRLTPLLELFSIGSTKKITPTSKFMWTITTCVQVPEHSLQIYSTDFLVGIIVELIATTLALLAKHV